VGVLLLSAIPTLTHADPLKLTGDALKASSELKSAYDDLSAAIVVVNRILQNQVPSADPDWTKIADEYDQAAKDANNASLPSDFIPRLNIVSSNEVLDCNTRPASLAKLNAYFGDLQTVKNNGQNELKKITQWQAEANRSTQILHEIQDDYDKLVLVPIFGPKFQLAWLDVHHRIPISLGHLKQARGAQKNKFTADLARLDTTIQTYQSNLHLLSLPSCSPTPGPTISATQTFYAGSGSAFTASFAHWQTTMDHIQISFTIDSTGRVLTGRVDADHHERVVSGNPGAIPDNHHVYTYARGDTSGNRINAAFYAAPGNNPRGMAVSFVGQRTGNRLNGTLFFARNDPPWVSWSGRSNVQ
jgi:hypothetical protein